MRTVLPRLTRDLPRPFAMDGMQRKDDTAQHKAVREALTNAIIHADFMANGTLKVEKLDDAFVFTNPGVLKLPVEQIYAGVEMARRNINKTRFVSKEFRLKIAVSCGFHSHTGAGEIGRSDIDQIAVHYYNLHMHTRTQAPLHSSP